MFRRTAAGRRNEMKFVRNKMRRNRGLKLVIRNLITVHSVYQCMCRKATLMRADSFYQFSFFALFSNNPYSFAQRIESYHGGC